MADMGQKDLPGANVCGACQGLLKGKMGFVGLGPQAGDDEGLRLADDFPGRRGNLADVGEVRRRGSVFPVYPPA